MPGGAWDPAGNYVGQIYTTTNPSWATRYDAFQLTTTPVGAYTLHVDDPKSAMRLDYRINGSAEGYRSCASLSENRKLPRPQESQCHRDRRSRRIGFAIAQRLIASGARVSLWIATRRRSRTAQRR